MKTISISQGIVPLGEFKTSISKWLAKIQQTRRPVIITQNGRPAAVLISPQEYDNLTERMEFIESVTRGIEDANTGRILTTEQMLDELKKARMARMEK